MKLAKILITAIIYLSLQACSHKTWQITNGSSIKIPIDSNTQTLADKTYEAYLQPYKLKIDSTMNEVIGQARETMRSHAPESLLSNFNADVYRQTATTITGSKIDIAIVNLGGLRTAIPAGKITVRKIYELMPFENELVILWLRGDKLKELLQTFARLGGEGISGLSMEINNKEAINIKIDGQQLDTEKLYSIATNDYLAGGNDRMIQLTQAEKRLNTGLKIRNILIDFIKQETQKGNKIESKLDGRIKQLNP